jgi:hypothetical protein
MYNKRSLGSSVSIMSDYKLDDRGSISGIANYFFSVACVQTNSEAHPTSCPVRSRGLFLGGKAQPGRDADHSPHSAKVRNE